MIINQYCYIANVGDSKVILSSSLGRKTQNLTKIHKPSNKEECKRIKNAGGTISKRLGPNNSRIYKVHPGWLSVTRSLGDIEAKDINMGGNPNVVISKPEINMFHISYDSDYILIQSDGLNDVVEDREVVSKIWKTLTEPIETSLHIKCAAVIEGIFKESVKRQSRKNNSAIIILFKGL